MGKKSAQVRKNTANYATDEKRCTYKVQRDEKGWKEMERDVKGWKDMIRDEKPWKGMETLRELVEQTRDRIKSVARRICSLALFGQCCYITHWCWKN